MRIQCKVLSAALYCTGVVEIFPYQFRFLNWNHFVYINIPCLIPPLPRCSSPHIILISSCFLKYEETGVGLPLTSVNRPFAKSCYSHMCHSKAFGTAPITVQKQGHRFRSQTKVTVLTNFEFDNIAERLSRQLKFGLLNDYTTERQYGTVV